MKWNKYIGFPLVFLLFTLFLVMDLGVVITDDLSNRDHPNWLNEIINESTGVYLLIPLVYLLFYFFSRFPLNDKNWKRRLPLYLLVQLAFGLSHTALMCLIRIPFYWLFDMGNYLEQYGLLQFKIPMEFFKQTLFYWVMVGAYQLLQQWQEKQIQQLKASELERQLSKARLMTLQMQLNPHFLFNTLNLVSSAMYEKPEVADKILADLGEMLRIALALQDRQEHSLEDELALLDRYIRIMKMRFEDRLQVDLEISAPVRPAIIPVFLLQPLLENAIKYSVESTGAASVWLTARKNGTLLQITCADSGPGINHHLPSANGNGIALNNTLQRLEERFGNNYLFSMVQNNGKGTLVTLEIPFATT
ncbi:MAG: histidine kinase [Lewinella sp.]|nr:histidine kinase [Lewinella sp.]